MSADLILCVLVAWLVLGGAVVTVFMACASIVSHLVSQREGVKESRHEA